MFDFIVLDMTSFNVHIGMDWVEILVVDHCSKGLIKCLLIVVVTMLGYLVINLN